MAPKRRVWMTTWLLIALMTAGCTTDEGDTDPADDHDEPDGTGDGMGEGMGDGTDSGTNGDAGGDNNQTAPPPGPRSITLTSDTTTGTVPLAVRFNLTLDGDVEGATWTLTFGDGSDPATADAEVGSETISFTYEIAGEFSASAVINFPDGDELGSEVIRITAELGESADPPPLHFEYGASAGCAGDFLQLGGANCISFLGGPENSGIDGHWQALDERYWGMGLVSSMIPAELTDSDCFFVADDAAEILGEGNNGGDGCLMDAIPVGTAWMFIYPYAHPAEGIIVDFSG